jgi:hypothetical protein
MTVVYIISTIIGIVVFVGLYYYLKYFIPLRPVEQGFEYVYIEDDGSAREIDDEDIEYLKTKFEPTDGARPYIKSGYDELTPDNKISGFILRRRVPKRIKIKPFPDLKDSEIISLIFLALAMASEKEPTDMNGIKMIADGINHAIPNDDEMQISITWLLNKKLINREGKKYSLTEQGETIYKKAVNNETTLIKIWNNVERNLNNYA